MRPVFRNVALVLSAAVATAGYAQTSASATALQARLSMPAALSAAVSAPVAQPHAATQSVHITMRVIDLGVADSAGLVGYQFQNSSSNFSVPRLVRAAGGNYSMTSGEKLAKIYMIVDANGVPSSLSVEHSDGAQFDREALAAAAAFRFQPALYNGVAVPARLSVELRVAKN